VPILIPYIHKLFNFAVKHSFPTHFTQRFIVHEFKRNKNINPFNYRTIMNNLLLAKLYRIILQKNINVLLENHGERDKWQAIFSSYHLTIYHLVTLKIIGEEFHNNRNNFLCWSPMLLCWLSKRIWHSDKN
jgi:hypothetical protein